MERFSVIDTEISGLKIIRPFFADDERGFFLKWFEIDTFKEFGFENKIDETIEGFSYKNVIRGLHFQLRKPQVKFVRATSGRVFDVAVDLRKGSPTFGKWQGVELSAENRNIFYIPAGFAHGYQVLSDTALVTYQCIGKYYPEGDSGIVWDDKDIGVQWKPFEGELILSEKDRGLPGFQDFLVADSGFIYDK